MIFGFFFLFKFLAAVAGGGNTNTLKDFYALADTLQYSIDGHGATSGTQSLYLANKNVMLFFGAENKIDLKGGDLTYYKPYNEEISRRGGYVAVPEASKCWDKSCLCLYKNTPEKLNDPNKATKKRIMSNVVDCIPFEKNVSFLTHYHKDCVFDKDMGVADELTWAGSSYSDVYYNNLDKLHPGLMVRYPEEYFGNYLKHLEATGRGDLKDLFEDQVFGKERRRLKAFYIPVAFKGKKECQYIHFYFDIYESKSYKKVNVFLSPDYIKKGDDVTPLEYDKRATALIKCPSEGSPCSDSWPYTVQPLPQDKECEIMPAEGDPKPTQYYCAFTDGSRSECQAQCMYDCTPGEMHVNALYVFCKCQTELGAPLKTFGQECLMVTIPMDNLPEKCTQKQIDECLFYCGDDNVCNEVEKNECNNDVCRVMDRKRSVATGTALKLIQTARCEAAQKNFDSFEGTWTYTCNEKLVN